MKRKSGDESRCGGFWELLCAVLMCLCGECMVLCCDVEELVILVVVVESVCDSYCGYGMYFVFMK